MIPDIRSLLTLIETATSHPIAENAADVPPSFDADEVVSSLIGEMRQCELVHADEYIGLFNEAVEDGTIAGPEIDEDEERPWRDQRFVAFLRAHVLQTLHRLRTGGPVRAWRALVADADWTPASSDRHIGQHWTYEKAKAIPYDYEDGSYLYVIEAMLPDAIIDWSETVLHHLTRDVDESEITIKDGAPVQGIVKVTRKPFRGEWW